MIAFGINVVATGRIVCTVTVIIVTYLAFPVKASIGGGRRNRNQRTSYAVPVYDRSITTLDPSGRLLQVEYAHEATMRRGCGSVAAMLLNDDTIYIALVKHSTTSAAAVEKPPSRPTTLATSHRKLHRLDQHLWMVGTGLVGDMLVAARHLRQVAQNNRSQRGEAWTVSQAATYWSAIQHQLTYTAGARPLGVSCVMIGVDENRCFDDASLIPSSISSSSINYLVDHGAETTDGETTGTSTRSLPPRLRLFKCSPGGSQEDCYYCTSGYGSDDILQSLHERYPKWKLSAHSGSSESVVPVVVDSADTTSLMDEATLIEEFIAAVRHGCGIVAHPTTVRKSDNARKMSRTGTETTTTNEHESVTMDVYVIRSNPRGRLTTTCYAGLSNSDSLEQMRRSVTQQSPMASLSSSSASNSEHSSAGS